MLLLGAVGRKLIRGTKFRWPDWFIGVDASLTAVTTGMTSLADLQRVDPKKTGVFLIIGLSAFILSMILHQDYDPDIGPNGEVSSGVIFWLGIVSNFVGLAALASILLLIKLG